jgi:endonuclease/exonuclease/phosphatase family metal-dependent hydrolase
MTAPIDTQLRILTYNTHVGVTIPAAVRHLLDTLAPHLVVLQEVQSPLARQRAGVLFSSQVWSSVGTQPASTGRGSSGTLIFGRRSVLEKVGESNDLITPFHDRFHPERRCTTGQFQHRPSGQVLDIGAVHLWTLKDSSIDPAVRVQHLAQLRAHVDSAVRARGAGRLPFRLGDFNQHLEGRGHSPAEQELARADLRPARPKNDHTRRIDEIFAPEELTRSDFRPITLPSHLPGVEGPHKALVVDVTIPRLVHQPHHVPAGQGAGRHQ